MFHVFKLWLHWTDVVQTKEKVAGRVGLAFIGGDLSVARELDGWTTYLRLLWTAASTSVARKGQFDFIHVSTDMTGAAPCWASGGTQV